MARQQAEAQLETAQANLVQARIARDDSVVNAPFDALVVEADASPGQIIQAGTSVGRIVASDAVEVSLGLTPAHVRLIGDLERLVGSDVTVFATGEADSQLANGTIVSTDPAIAQTSRTANVLVSIPDPFTIAPRALRLNELVEIALDVDAPPGALQMPPQALGLGNLVWEIAADGTLARHSVDVLQRDEAVVTIQAPDLQPGAQVMTTALPSAVAGQSVRTEETAPGAQADPDGQP